MTKQAEGIRTLDEFSMGDGEAQRMQVPHLAHPGAVMRLRRMNRHFLTVFAPITALAQQPKVFYLYGAEEERTVQTFPSTPGGLREYKGFHLYELNAATMDILRALDLDANSPNKGWFGGSPNVGMLTGDRKTIVLFGGGNEDETTLNLVSVRI
jgi:hypothetical protein